MAVLYNNLLINGKSKKYKPFLVNLVSGRRRILDIDEALLISSILHKNKASSFTQQESQLCEKLFVEKQFIDNHQRKAIEKHMIESNYFTSADKPREDLVFSIQLTQACNMRCPFCFERGYADSKAQMTEEMIHAIVELYKFCSIQYGVDVTPSIIRVTGGEPLINQKSVDMIKHIADMWPESALTLFTNGLNLLKYYNQLPLDRLEVDISLDGLENTHLLKRKPVASNGSEAYKDIVSGIKRLLKDQVTVRLKTIIDKDNYQELPDFITFLRDEGILESPNLTHIPGTVSDYSNPLDIDVLFNNKHEAIKIQDYLMSTCGYTITPFIGLTTLWMMVSRTDNKPHMPRNVRCSTNFPANLYFSPNGKIYFCDCMDSERGIIGAYYPKINLDMDMIEKLNSRSVMNYEKCRECPYKFVCLGNCPLAAFSKGEEMSCGVFADTEIMDNLEYPYYELNAYRS